MMLARKYPFSFSLLVLAFPVITGNLMKWSLCNNPNTGHSGILQQRYETPKPSNWVCFMLIFSVIVLHNSTFTALERAHNMLVYPVYIDYRYHYPFGDLQGIQGEW